MEPNRESPYRRSAGDHGRHSRSHIVYNVETMGMGSIGQNHGIPIPSPIRLPVGARKSREGGYT